MRPDLSLRPTRMSMSERGATWPISAVSLNARPVTPKLAVSTAMAVARSRVPAEIGFAAGFGASRMPAVEDLAAASCAASAGLASAVLTGGLAFVLAAAWRTRGRLFFAGGLAAASLSGAADEDAAEDDASAFACSWAWPALAGAAW